MAYTYKGTKITGTSTTAKVFKKSGVKNAKRNQTYFNTETGHVYTCDVAGKPSTAKWKYTRTDIAKKPSLQVSNLAVPARTTVGTNTRYMKSTWKVPSGMTNTQKGDRGQTLTLDWWLGIAGKDPKRVKAEVGMGATESSVNLNNFIVGNTTYKRNSFYPFTDTKLNYVTFGVKAHNSKGDGPEAKATRNFSAPVAPAIEPWEFVAGSGKARATITTDEGAGYAERYDTRYVVTVTDTHTGQTWNSEDTSSTDTSITVEYDAPDYQELNYDEYIRVSVDTWARGYAGDSAHATDNTTYYISYPAQTTIESIDVSGKAPADKCTVRINTNNTEQHPVDQVRLGYLANVAYATADAIPGDATWTWTDIVDDGSCTALAMPVGDLLPDRGNHTWVCVKSYHANEEVLFRYSEFREVSTLFVPSATAADETIVIVSAQAGADGESAVVQLGWDPNGTDDATGTELSWSDEMDTWKSTKAPDVHEFDWEDTTSGGQSIPVTYEGVTYRRSATITIKGLDEGQVYYVKARRYLEGETAVTYSNYSNTATVIPNEKPESIVASADRYVQSGGSLMVRWTFAGNGLQRAWQIVKRVQSGGQWVDDAIIANGEGSIGSTQISAKRLASFANSNGELTYNVQASTGSGFVRSEDYSVTIIEPPTLEITGSSLVHIHEEDEQTYTGDIVQIDNSRDVLGVKSLSVELEPIQSGSGTPSPTNVRPISGRTECDTYVRGVNVWDEEWELGTFNTTTGVNATSTTQIRSKNHIPIKSDTDYYFNTPTGMWTLFFDKNKTAIPSGAPSGYATSGNSVMLGTSYKTFTAPSNACYVRFYLLGGYGTTYNNDISINYPSTDTSYHAYNGDTYTTPLGRTVYGGTLEQVGGQLMDRLNLINLDGTTQCTPSSQTSDVVVFAAAFSWNGWALHSSTPNAISNRFSTSTPSGQAGRMVMVDRYLYFVIAKSELSSLDESGARAWLNDHPTQVCYELATPQTYQLTPTEVALVVGQNNVWSEGSIELTTAEVLLDGDFLRTNNLSIDLEASQLCDLITIVSSQGATGQFPQGVLRQTNGDTIHSDVYEPEWTEETNAFSTTINLPTALDFWDGGRYTASVVAVDRRTGLRSAEATLEVPVLWEHQAMAPFDFVTLTPLNYMDDENDMHHQAVQINLTPPTGSAETDVYDIYRMTGDGARLIGQTFPLTCETTDEFAPFGDDLTCYYRVALRTIDGDVEFSDIEYNLEGNTMRFDWSGGTLELPYNLSIADTYKKDVDIRKHMDGSVDGYWNRNIERTGSLSSDAIRLVQQDDITAARRLARYPGAVFVRTPDGSAYEADVQVTDLSTEGVMTAIAIDAQEIGLTQEFILPTPYPLDEGEAE